MSQEVTASQTKRIAVSFDRFCLLLQIALSQLHELKSRFHCYRFYLLSKRNEWFFDHLLILRSNLVTSLEQVWRTFNHYYKFTFLKNQNLVFCKYSCRKLYLKAQGNDCADVSDTTPYSQLANKSSSSLSWVLSRREIMKGRLTKPPCVFFSIEPVALKVEES